MSTATTGIICGVMFGPPVRGGISMVLLGRGTRRTHEAHKKTGSTAKSEQRHSAEEHTADKDTSHSVGFIKMPFLFRAALTNCRLDTSDRRAFVRGVGAAAVPLRHGALRCGRCRTLAVLKQGCQREDHQLSCHRAKLEFSAKVGKSAKDRNCIKSPYL